jgi:FkbM family methyltransferase
VKGKQATHWTRLSCHRFRANEARLQLSLLAYNLGNLWRGAAEENRRLVADELAAAVGEDGRTAGQARPLLLVVAGRGTPAPAAVWPDAPANLGSAERVAPRLRLQILGLRKVGWGSVRENDCTAASGICQTAEAADETPPNSLGPALMANSLLSRAGEAYDARDRGPNRKSWISSMEAHESVAKVLRHARFPGRRLVVDLTERIFGTNRGEFIVPLRHGGRLIIDGVLDQPVFYTGAHDCHIMDFLIRAANTADTVVDVGAGIGIYTVALALKVGPNGHVYAFEALRANFELLERNIKLNGLTNVTAVYGAVTNSTGTLAIPHFSSRPGGLGGLGNYSLKSKSNEQTIVGSYALDEFFLNHGVTKINLMKIDVEGSEVMAIKGMKNFFSAGRVLITCCEVNPAWLREMGTDPGELYELFLEFGLRVFRLTRLSRLVELKKEDLPSGPGWIDCVAIR